MANKGNERIELDDLFDAALELSPTDRRAFIAQITSRKLRNELVSLLAANDAVADGQFLGDSAVDGASDSTHNAEMRSGCSIETPALIGRYEVSRCLGQGSFGIVFLAHDPQLDRPVAIKRPHKTLFEQGLSVNLFVEEARSVARLDHPALVSIYDVQVDDGWPFVVQQYVDGEDLGEHISKENSSYENLVQILVEIAHAVGVLHQNDIVHRDLKPSNILIDRAGHVHIADFGMAIHERDRFRRRGEVSGTPAYMSPEQVKGESHYVDGRSDIWAIGVIFYELLTGVRPFRGESRADLFTQILSCEPKPLRQLQPAIPKELQRICIKCVEKRRSDRYQSTAGLIDDLEH